MNDFLEDKVWILKNHESWKLIVFDIFPRGMDINIFILEPKKKKKTTKESSNLKYDWVLKYYIWNMLCISN